MTNAPQTAVQSCPHYDAKFIGQLEICPVCASPLVPFYPSGIDPDYADLSHATEDGADSRPTCDSLRSIYACYSAFFIAASITIQTTVQIFQNHNFDAQLSSLPLNLLKYAAALFFAILGYFGYRSHTETRPPI